MKYLSVCSGMEAATVAWHHMGWTPVGFSEIEPFPSAILKHRFPNVPNYGDLTKQSEWPIEPGSIDLLVGGTPCQSFSIGGKREGLDDPRGQLMFSFLELAGRLRPRWVLWENVPGVLSSGKPKGSDFGCFLQGLVERGYGVSYRVYDAVHFGVPQRRRRVFVVGCLGDWRAAAEVLSIRDGLRRHLTKGHQEGEETSSDSGKVPEGCRVFRKSRRAQSVDDYETWVPDEKSNTLNTFDLTGDVRSTHAVIEPMVYENHGQDSRITGPLKVAPSVVAKFGTGGNNVPLVDFNMRVRRLTCVEVERLQGFPDNWSRIPWKGKPEEKCPDGPRYKACGNSMAVPVMRHIGEKINNYAL
jgi:DNA (cytosine-5)-methyltransferase 1